MRLMELPIVTTLSGGAGHSAAALVRAIKRADVILARTAATETTLAGATAFINTARPEVHICNFAAEVHVPTGTTATDVLGELREHFDQTGVACAFLQAHNADWPVDLVKAAEEAGYTRGQEAALMLLSRRVSPTQAAPAMQIVPARAVQRDLRAFHETLIRPTFNGDDALTAQLTATFLDHLDEPRLEAFVARIDGQIVGQATLVNLGDIGVIDNVQTLPDYSGRGVATALLGHVLDHATRAQVGSVILECLPNTPASRLYEKLGFSEVRRFAKWIRKD